MRCSGFNIHYLNCFQLLAQKNSVSYCCIIVEIVENRASCWSVGDWTYYTSAYAEGQK